MQDMDNKDLRVVNALGTEFAEFQKLALMVKEQPATRPYAEARMARLLNGMSPTRRVEVHRALLGCGGKTARLARGRR